MPGFSNGELPEIWQTRTRLRKDDGTRRIRHMPSYLESKVQTTGSIRLLISNTRYLAFFDWSLRSGFVRTGRCRFAERFNELVVEWIQGNGHAGQPSFDRLEAVILDSCFRLNVAQQEVFPLHLLQDELMIIHAVRMSMLVQ